MPTAYFGIVIYTVVKMECCKMMFENHFAISYFFRRLNYIVEFDKLFK